MTHRDRSEYKTDSSVMAVCKSVTIPGMTGHVRRNTHPEDQVFKGLKYSSYTNVALLQWALRAGVEKHVTFHAGRHSFAVALLSRGVSIYQVSRLLGHSELRTTEIYSDILDEDRTRTMRFLVPRILSEEDEPETTNSCPHCGHPLEVAD